MQRSAQLGRERWHLVSTVINAPFWEEGQKREVEELLLDGGHVQVMAWGRIGPLSNSGGFIWIAVPSDIYGRSCAAVLSPQWAGDAIVSSNNRGAHLTHTIEKNEIVASKKQIKKNPWFDSAGNVAASYKQPTEPGDRAQRVNLRRDRTVSFCQQNCLIRNPLGNVTSQWRIACLRTRGDRPAIPGKRFIVTKLFFLPFLSPPAPGPPKRNDGDPK